MIFTSSSLVVSFFLLQCYPAPAQATSNIKNTTLDCSTASKVVLGKEKQIITFRSEKHNTACKWPIPQTLQRDEYALVILLENVILPKHSEGCSAEIRFPKTAFRCEFDPGYCSVYATSPTHCNLEKINKETLQNYTSSCEKFTYWTKTETAEIEYDSSNRASIHKEFALHYIPVYCPEPTTTTTTTTTTTSTTSAISTTKSSTNQDSAITPASSVTKTNFTIHSNYTTLQRDTVTQVQAAAVDISTIGLVIGATALILLLVIGLFLHRKKQRVSEFPDITERNFRKTDEMEFYEEYNGDTQQKETHPEDNQAEETQPDSQQESSEENEVKTEYENTSYQPSDIYSAVVKKT